MVFKYDKKRKRYKLKITMLELVSLVSSLKALVAFLYVKEYEKSIPMHFI